MQSNLFRARCDASIRNNKRGIGFVIYDLNKEPIYHYYEEVKRNYSILQLEMYALYRCLQELRSRGITKIKIRSDNKSVIDILRGKITDSSTDILVYRIKNFLEPKFERVKYKWIPRLDNTVADELCKLATR